MRALVYSPQPAMALVLNARDARSYLPPTDEWGSSWYEWTPCIAAVLGTIVGLRKTLT